MHVIDSLRESEIFENLSDEHLQSLAVIGRGAHHRKDSIIFEEGAAATDLYILRSGTVMLEMSLQPEPGRPVIPTPLEVVTPGDCFGWSAIVEPHTYTLSARCVEDCSTVAMGGGRLLRILSEDPELGFAVMRSLSRIIGRRLANTRSRLTNGLGLILHPHELRVPG